ncbi:MAG: Rpn family recombination-promoting nuclease/putative transposase [Bacilli bacterium]|nr:Rpn family recombination-promoting nuclease/putative transposase [Bacilli bacterium]
MEKQKFYTCKNDKAFKEVFMKKENKDILIPLLETCLNIKINDIEYLNLEDNVDYLNTRKKSYDLRLSTEVGRIQVEVNANIYQYSRIRQVAYLSNEYSHVTLAGDDYSEDLNVIQINFTYGLMTRFNEKYQYLYDEKDYRVYKLRDEEGKEYVDNYKIYEFNMDYYLNFWYNKDEKMIDKYKFLIMMNLDLENLEKLKRKSKVVEKYMEEINKINKDPKFIEYMSYEEDQRKMQNTLLRKAKEEGLEKGLEQGSKEKANEVVLKMKEEGLDSSLISKITGLTIEEIKNI